MRSYFYNYIQTAIFLPYDRGSILYSTIMKFFSRVAFYSRLDLYVSVFDRVSECSKYAFYISYCRKVIRAYQDSWDNRCRLLFCCMGNSDRNRVSSMKKLINREDIRKNLYV